MNPILLTSSVAIGRHVPMYIGIFDIGTPVGQVRHVSKNLWGVKIQPLMPPEPRKTKTKTKSESPSNTRPSTPRMPKVPGNLVQKPGPNPKGSPKMGTSRPALVKPVTQSSMSSTNSEPWLKATPASKPNKSDTPAYTILPGDSQTFALEDGQIIGYAERGRRSPTAKIVYMFHGTPGSRLDGDLDRWGMMNNVKFICAERPGYGLSSLKRDYTVLEHSEHVLRLSRHLGHHNFTTFGISGGAPYALALAHLASKEVVTGTVLVVPQAPPGAPTDGADKSMSFYLKRKWVPGWAEASLRDRFWVEQANYGEDQKSIVNKVWRKSEVGRKGLTVREARGSPAAWFADLQAMDKPWGFDCCDVDAKNIVIFAGGLDENTSAEGAKWMRQRLRNSRLEFIPLADHYTLQQQCNDKILKTLRDI